MGNASRLFNGTAENTLYGRITPSPEQREFLQQKWNALAEYLKASLSENYQYPVSTWLQGSYKFGTLIKPVHLHEEYDVDVGIYFSWPNGKGATPAAGQLRDWVQHAITEYKEITPGLKEVEDPAKERCSRAIYENHFHVDTPVYHLEPDEDKRRLACLSNKWENSDPKALYRWFKDAVDEDYRDQLRRIIRYLKGWAAVSFEKAPQSRPSSVFLTVLSTLVFKDYIFWKLAEPDDDDALIAVIRKLSDRLIKDRRVPNPVDEAEDLNRMTDDAWGGFLPRLRALRDAAERAAEASDEVIAALAWSEVFSFLMPLPETESVEVIEENNGHALMQLPDIDIEIYSRNPRKLLQRVRNEVPSVAKDRDLVFIISNQHIVPDFASVEWTVRNNESEAETIGDLGHRRGGSRAMSAEEHTKYTGRHYMDCVVRSNGQVYAVRRVPVNVIGVASQPRNSPRPSYTKLRTIHRRR